MRQYLSLLQYVNDYGKKREDRTGTGTLSVFGTTLRFDLQDGFPLITTKKIHTKSIIHELLWFLQGDRNMNVKYLQDNGVRIWNEWADEDGNLGPIYGAQWRNWVKPKGLAWGIHGGAYDAENNHYYVDQLKEVIGRIKAFPTDRRLLVSAWNPGELHLMQLPPCHYSFQYYVTHDYKLSCLVNQRSADMFLGVPFDIASYAFLTHMVASVCGLVVGDLIMHFGDTHIYLNHLDQVREQLSRSPRDLPKLQLYNRPDIDSFQYSDFNIVGYDPWPSIKGEVSK